MIRIFKLIVVFFLVSNYVPCEAQISSKYLVEVGKLFDSETGTFQEDMVILVDGNKITSVINKRTISENDKKGRQILDLKNYTVLPGLIDAHTHLLLREIVSPKSEYPGLEMIRPLTLDGDAYRALYGAARAKAYLEAGITAVQDVGNSGMFADLALRRAISEGLLPGPRMICSGPGLAAEGGQFQGLTYDYADIARKEYRIVKGIDDAVQAVRENINQGAEVIKIYAENTPNRTSLSIGEMSAIVKEAHRFGVRVTAHATGNQAAYNAVISGVDGVDHGYQLEDSTLRLMAAKGVILIPTDGDSLIFNIYLKIIDPNDKTISEKIKFFMGSSSKRLMQAIKIGVIIAAGSDDYPDLGLPFSSMSKRTLLGYSQEGMTIPQILNAATVNAAIHINRSKDLGKIKSGYLADIIAVDNNLDTDIGAIMKVHFVMKGGAIVLNH